MSSNSFLVLSLGSSLCSIMSSANSDHLTSFPIFIPFTSFFFSDCHRWTSKTMLNKSDESGYPCLVPDLRGNAFSFSPLSMMLAVDLSYTFVFIVSRYVPSVPTVGRVFNHKWELNFVKSFFFIY